jgi:mannose-6-phosphate isomerase-like protein (cupin superfamily)
MRITNPNTVTEYASEHGEIVRELLGVTAGGSRGHSLAQIAIPPGKASRKHYHPDVEESYMILSGTGRMEIDGESAMLGPSDTVAILPRQVHQIFNAGEVDLVFLAICVPAWTPDNSVFLD